MNQSRAPLPPINFAALADALLARADALVAAWLPGGHREGHEYKCGSLSGGKGSSCSINLVTGAWADFATDEKGGDLIGLYKAIHGLADMGKAAVQVARDEGLEDVAGVQRDAQHQRAERPPAPPAPPAPQRPRESWQTLLPVPDFAPEPTFSHYHRGADTIARKATYRVGGQLLGYVVRFRTSDGGKDDIPYTFCQSAADGAAKWQWRQFDEPRPLFLPGGELPAREGEAPRTVVLVEGERKAEMLQALLDGGAPGVYVVASWPGGSKAWDKALWSWVAGCTVVAWPDCDSQREQLTTAERKACGDDPVALEVARAAKPFKPADKQPGLLAMRRIGWLLTREHGCAVSILPIDEPGVRKSGWDAADAIEEGWDFDRVLKYFGQAQPLPPDPDAAAPEPAPGAGGGGEPPKKIEGPVGTADGDDVGSSRPMPWWLAPYWDDVKERWLVSRKLVIRALEEDPALAGVLGANQLTNTIDARRDWPWPHGKAGPVRASTELMLGAYLSRTYGLPSIARAALAEGIETVAYSNPFHPVREYLAGLAWDGKPRLAKWLMFVIGETPDTLPPRVAEYLALVGQYFVMGLVARVLDPGCKFDYCLVLEGKGGRYKSTALKTLVGKAFFSDTRFDVQKNKEAQEQVQGVWLYELGELAHFNKAGVDEIKAFVSSEVDRYRPAYGKQVDSFPRQCVLAATTNNRKYLRDKTGNRRFWPVPVAHVMNVAWIERWRDQLFAEAQALYLAGERYWPDEDTEERLFVPMQQERLVVDAIEEELLRLLTRSPGVQGSEAEINELTAHVSVAQLIKALGVDVGKANAGLQSQIRAWLDQEGWDQKKVPVGPVRLMRYVRPARWPEPELDGDEGAPPDVPPAGDAGAVVTANATGADDEPF